MKFLVVDDELVSRSKMQSILGEFGECVLAESGQDALVEFAHAWSIGAPFDVIMLDIAMSGISGIDVLKKLRHIESGMNIGKERTAIVVMVSSYADQNIVLESIKAGCNNYIVKPFNRDRVIDKLKDLKLK